MRLSGPAAPSPSGDIRLLERRFESVAGRIFDTAALKAALEPQVEGEKRSDGNVCPHVHHHLHKPL